jgi:hypothetical protein
MRMTSVPHESPSSSASINPAFPYAAARAAARSAAEPQTLSGDLVHFFGDCGVMKAAVDAELRAVAR